LSSARASAPSGALSIPQRCDSETTSRRSQRSWACLSIPQRCDSEDLIAARLGVEVEAFNTSKVRFRGGSSRRARSSTAPFNTSKVRFRAAKPSKADDHRHELSIPQRCDSERGSAATSAGVVATFNTSKVRFRVFFDAVFLPVGVFFQYLKGAIQSIQVIFSGLLNICFQYLKGAIQSRLSAPRGSRICGLSIPQRCDSETSFHVARLSTIFPFNTSKVRFRAVEIEGTMTAWKFFQYLKGAIQR